MIHDLELIKRVYLNYFQLMATGEHGDLMEVVARIVDPELNHVLALVITQAQPMVEQPVLIQPCLHDIAILTPAQVSIALE